MPSATSSPKGPKKFIAVAKSPLLKEPTIFESWARAHVVVTGISYKEAPHKGFKNLEEARKWMEKQGVTNPKVFLQPEEDLKGVREGFCYYAVANGRNPGVTEIYTGPDGAQDEVHKFKGSCYKSFPTRKQAEGFIEEWKDQWLLAAALVLRRELDQGSRPTLINGTSWFPSLRTAEAVEEEAVEVANLAVGLGQLSFS